MLSSLRSRASGPAVRKLVLPPLPRNTSASIIFAPLARHQSAYAQEDRQAYAPRERAQYPSRDRSFAPRERKDFGDRGRGFGGPPRNQYGRDRRGGEDHAGGGNFMGQRHQFGGGSNGRRESRMPRAMEGEDEILEGTAEKRTDYITKFEDLKTSGQIEPVLIDTITRKMGFDTMTAVQSKTINETLGGVDVIAQARTGTGKTLAFLLPILQSIIKKDPTLVESLGSRGRRYRAPDIRAVIISPTRELAEQIAAEANQLVANTSIAVQCAVGGTLKNVGLKTIMTQGCNLLVGTPGRLKDIFSDQFAQLDLSKASGFVLDEADRLLDDGFYPDIMDIERSLPPKKERHNLLFSATVPREVLDLAQNVLNDGSRFVQTIEKGEAQTHEKVPQNLVQCNGLENMLPTLTELVVRQKDQPEGSMPFKALVFLNANAEVALYSEIFRRMERDLKALFKAPVPILEMHSRLTQNRRTYTANRFRQAERAIMFTSDVSARGMDYPNVSHVIQLGAPRTRDFYIHRIGRTGRGEKSGESWILVPEMESYEARKTLRKLPIKEDNSLQCAKADLASDPSPEVQQTLKWINGAAEKVDPMIKSDAFRGALGYMSHISDKRELIEGLNAQAKLVWGMDRSPGISPMLASKLGVAKFANLEESSRFGRPQARGASWRSRDAPDGRGNQRFSFDRTRENQDRSAPYSPRARAWA